MRLSLLLGTALMGLAAISPARADLNQACQTAWSDYQMLAPPRAFATSLDGHCGFAGGRASLDQARQDAIGFCRRSAKVPCAIRDENFGGRSGGAEQAPLIGPFRADPLHLYHGPRAARGVVVWSHGRTRGDDGVVVDSRDNPSPPLIRAFSNAGWDIYRFDRDPETETVAGSGDLLIAGVDALRMAGYGRVILAGQSQGAWLSLRALDARQDLYGVIALAPAHHGREAKSKTHDRALADFTAMTRNFKPSPARVVLALFAEDEFDPDGPARLALAREAAIRTGMPLLAIANDPTLSGHGAGTRLPMAHLYAACILRFFEGAADASSCRH